MTPAYAQDGCPDSGDPGNTYPIIQAFKSDNSCQVTEGKALKKWGSYRIDLEATASGHCNVYTIPPECPLYQTQIRSLGASAIQERVPNGASYFIRVVQPVGSVQYYSTVGPVNTEQTSPTWSPFYVGNYTLMDSTNVNATACNFSPTTYFAPHINVYVASGFHRGDSCNGGSIASGAQLGEATGSGRYHYHGQDPPSYQDTWAVSEHLIQTIKDVGLSWSQSFPSAPRMGTGDMSDPNGGPMPPHGCHENGLEVDVRYVRNDGLEAPLDLAVEPNKFDRTLTIELLRQFVNSNLDLIYVDPATNITPTDVPGVVVDKSGGHSNHFHVKLRDPDGPDSNNCY